MSPIGRVFIIVNLILAAAFLGVAGTFLQNQTHWKGLYDTEKAAHETYARLAESTESDLRNDVSAKELSLTSTNDLLQTRTTERDAGRAENERLSKQLDTMEGNINQLTSQTAAMRSSIDASVNMAQEAYSQSAAAQKEKDDAVQAMEDAVANLRDATFQGTQLQDQIQALTAQISDLGSELSQSELLVAAAVAKGFLATTTTAQPDLRGVVSMVGAAGRLITVRITENPANAEITPGIRFAIFSGETYKGDVLIDSIEGTHAFGKLFAGTGVTILPGDQAATKLN